MGKIGLTGTACPPSGVPQPDESRSEDVPIPAEFTQAANDSNPEEPEVTEATETAELAEAEASEPAKPETEAAELAESAAADETLSCRTC